ncbi:MAG: transketolase family protein [Bdellovibrionales bacterium]|nr:transketolase family protein [Bdellovibrionales bacterium]
MKASRASFGEALANLGGEFKNIVVMDADLSKSTKSDGFASKYPDRFFQMGIQEANMIGAAAGMAFSGKIPFLCSFGAFLTGRFDTIRVTVGYAAANVRLVGTHSGIGIGEDGYSQMALEDIACMRTLPGMAVLQPADDTETKAMMRYLVDHRGPVYLRLTRQNLPAVSPQGYKFEFGKLSLLKEGTDAVIFATGGLVGHSLEAAQQLQKEGLKIAVANIHTIKPIDRNGILKLAETAKVIFTAEDHNIIGGLGGAVAEVLAEAGLGKRLVRIGVHDTYGESGSPEGLYQRHGLDTAGVARTMKSTLSGF